LRATRDEYEGDPNVDERFVSDLVAACQAVAAKVKAFKATAK
jgi:hypothetical protein